MRRKLNTHGIKLQRFLCDSRHIQYGADVVENPEHNCTVLRDGSCTVHIVTCAGMDIANLRKDYRAGELDHGHLSADPLTQFRSWFSDAAQSGSRWRKLGIAIYKLWFALLGHPPADANAMTLATVDEQCHHSTRTVLLKGSEERG